MRVLGIAALLALVCGGAQAQGLAGSGGLGINANDLQVSIHTGVLYQEGVFIGPRAGMNSPSITQYGIVGIGPSALMSANTSGIESVCVGAFACEFLTNGYAVTGLGEHTVGYDNSSYATAVGNDSMRDVVGENNSTGVGAQTIRDGTGNNNTAIGAFSLQGNAGSIQISGTVTPGDVITATFTSTNPNVTGLGAVHYTVVGGDTVSTIATGLAAAISGSGIVATLPSGISTLTDNGVTLGAFTSWNSSAPGYVALHFPGGNTTGWALTPTMSCAGTCTETLTVYGPISGTDNIAIGVRPLYGAGLTTGTANIAIGTEALLGLTGAANNNVAIGWNAGHAATNDGNNVIIGFQAGVALNGGGANGYNTIIGTQAGAGITTGIQNTILGGKNQNGSAITTGNGNVEIGYGAGVQSATSGWQLSIQNAIWGGGNSVGGGGGYGWIGVYAPSGNAAFTVGDAGGNNSTYGSHMGVLQTTAPTITSGTATLDATASDTAGTVTEGTSQTGFTLTFHVAFQTAPHCIVTSPSGNAFTSYTPSTTTLVVANSSQTSSKYSYVCLQ